MSINFSISGQVFQDTLFTNQAVYPFEIHRLIPRVYAMDNASLLLGTQPDFSLLAALIRLDITDLHMDMKLTKAPTLIDAMVKGTTERTWEWAEPYTMPNSAGFQIAATSLAAPATFAGSGITQLRLVVTFQGFQLQLAAPSDSR
jgi:hypothetical protein